MKIYLPIVAMVLMVAGCAVEPSAPHYTTWKEKLDAKKAGESQLNDLVLHDMMMQHQAPMIDPTQLGR